MAAMACSDCVISKDTVVPLWFPMVDEAADVDGGILAKCKAAGIEETKTYLEQGKVATSCCSRQNQERISKNMK